MATQVIGAREMLEYSGRDAGQAAERAAERNRALMAAQMRARRGPTPEVLFAKRFDNSRIVKAADPVRAKEMRTFACVMLVLFGLIMMYGLQHYSGLEYGYRIESEKAQLRHLQEQNRQLKLTEAQLSDPARIDALSRQLGLAVPTPGQVVRPDASLDANGPVLAETHPLLPSMH